MQKKKAAITLFIILGLVLLSITLFVYHYASKQESLKNQIFETNEVPFDKNQIKAHITRCIGSVGNDALEIIGVQGGYMDPDDYLSLLSYDISYLYLEGKSLVPSVDAMEAEISAYVQENILECINLSTLQYDIADTGIGANATIYQDKVSIWLDPIEAKKGQISIKVKGTRKDFPVRLGHIKDIADDIINSTIQDPEVIDNALINRFDLPVSVEPFTENIFLYNIVDKSANKLYHFQFAVLLENTREDNHAPVFVNLEDLEAQVGNKMIYDVAAEDIDGDDLTFSSITTLFDIAPDGRIEFTPSDYDLGTHLVTLFVEDQKGASSQGMINVLVKG